VARQVFTQRGFVAKLLLAKSDMADLQTLDTDLTKCLQDMGVGVAWWGSCHSGLFVARRSRRRTVSVQVCVCSCVCHVPSCSPPSFSHPCKWPPWSSSERRTQT
jgi:hypothetical protein